MSRGALGGNGGDATAGKEGSTGARVPREKAGDVGVRAGLDVNVAETGDEPDARHDMRLFALRVACCSKIGVVSAPAPGEMPRNERGRGLARFDSSGRKMTVTSRREAGWSHGARGRRGRAGIREVGLGPSSCERG
jgi:hypothetical protein